MVFPSATRLLDAEGRPRATQSSVTGPAASGGCFRYAAACEAHVGLSVAPCQNRALCDTFGWYPPKGTPPSEREARPFGL
jgi:hypothetical protein